MRRTRRTKFLRGHIEHSEAFHGAIPKARSLFVYFKLEKPASYHAFYYYLILQHDFALYRTMLRLSALPVSNHHLAALSPHHHPAKADSH